MGAGSVNLPIRLFFCQNQSHVLFGLQCRDISTPPVFHMLHHTFTGPVRSRDSPSSGIHNNPLRSQHKRENAVKYVWLVHVKTL